MSVLAVHAGSEGVTAVVVTDEGDVAAEGHRAVARHVPQPGWVEHGVEEIWQAVLGATRAALAQVDAAGVRGIGIATQRESVVLWDRETLGSPRRAIGSPDRRTADVCARLAEAGHGDRVAGLSGRRLDTAPGFLGTTLVWLAEHEPHTWALVGDGRYAVGTVDSYLVARMTRGLEHVTDVSHASRTLLLDLAAGAWSDELCGLLGVPRDALPELVPSWGELAVTDPRTFLGLALPVAGLAGDRQAVLFGQACFAVGDTACTDELGSPAQVLTTTGSTLERPVAGLAPTVAWRSPDGGLTYALEGAVDAIGALPVAVSSLRVDGAGAADDDRCRQLADRVGVRVDRPRLVDTAALGAAFLAGLGTGVWDTPDALREARRSERSYDPTPQVGRAQER